MTTPYEIKRDNTAPTAPKEAAKAAAGGTEYVILEAHPVPTDKSWRDVARVTARSANEAIRLAIKDGSKAGTYVAIPARSFQPVTVKVETKTVLTIA